MSTITNRKEARALIIKKLTDIAADASIARSLMRRFFPDATITKADISLLASRAVDIRAIVDKFND